MLRRPSSTATPSDLLLVLPVLLAALTAWPATGAAQALAQVSPPKSQTLPQTPSQTQSPTPSAPAAPLACLILPERTADLGSPVAGVVDTVEVERGDTVRKGQVLARLRAEVERANVGVVRSRAESEAEQRGAIAARDLAQLKVDRARTLAAQNFVSGQAVELAESELRIATERVSQAREQLGTTAREVSSAQAQAAQRVLRAPFDGVITERYLHPGERIEEKPLLKIAVITSLRVEVVAPVALFGRVQMGQELRVEPELAGIGPRMARVVQVDQVLEPASNTFRVRLALPNADARLPAGLRCRVALEGTDARGAAAAVTVGARSVDAPRQVAQDLARR